MAKLILKSIAYYPQALAELPMSHKDLGLIDTDKPYKKLIISTQNRHLYRLVDQQTGQVLKAQKLIRDHNDLKVYVGDVIVVEMKDFFSFQNATTVKAEEEPLYMVDAGEATCISGLISPSEGINLPEMYVLWEPGLPVQTCLNPNAMALMPIAGLAGISGLTTGGAIGISTAVGVSIVQANLTYGKPPVILPKLKGAVFAGPVIGQIPVGGNIKVSGLKVQAFDAKGNSLGVTDVKADGTYELELTNPTYKGALVLKVFDPAGDSVTAKYMDEATGKEKAFTTMLASVNYQGDATKPVTVNITALTNLAATKAGAEATDSGVSVPSADEIDSANTQVAKKFLNNSSLADSPVIPTVNVDGSSNLSTANTYGIALALLSQIESVSSKTTAQVADLLSRALTSPQDTNKAAISYVNQALANMINSGFDAIKIQKMVNALGNTLTTGSVSLSSNAGQSFNFSTTAPDENSKLTATVSNFVDANNTNNANKAFSNPSTYQWQASTDGLTWTNILGDNAKTVDFTLTQSQVGQKVRVLVKNTDETGFDEYLASAATLAVKNVNQLTNTTSVQDSGGYDAAGFNKLLVPTTNIDTVLPVLRSATTSSSGGVNKLILTYSETLNNLANFTEALGAGTQAAAVPVFSTATVTAGEASQNITSLVFQVSGLIDGSNEQINIDGSTNISLVTTASATTATNAMTYSIAMSGTNNSIATVTLNKVGGITSTQAQSLIAGISYRNANADNPTPGVRIFDITSVTDSSGLANQTTTYALGANSASVLVTATNDVPTFSTNTAPTGLATTNSQAPSKALNINTRGFVVADPDGGNSIETISFGIGDITAPLYVNSANPLAPLNIYFPNKPNSLYLTKNSSNNYFVNGTVSDLNEWLQLSNSVTYNPRTGYTGTTSDTRFRITDSLRVFSDSNTFTIGVTADTIAPVFSKAVVSSEDSKKIILSYDEPLNTSAANLPLTSQFLVAGSQPTSLAVVGTNIVLTMAANVAAGATVTYTKPATGTAAIQDAAGIQSATISTVTGATDSIAPVLEASPVFYNGDSGIHKFTLYFNEDLASASNLSPAGFNVAGFSVAVVDPVNPSRTGGASTNWYQSGGSSSFSEKAFAISFNFGFLSPSASIQVKYVDPGASNPNALKDLAGNHATHMVLGAWTNDILSAVDAAFTSGKSVQVVGGMGNDTMTSGLANDTFTWFAGDAGTAGAVDIVKGFVPLAGTTGDKLDISKLLIGYTGGTNLSQWVTVFSNASGAPSGVSATNTKIVIDVDGSGSSSVTQTIWLEGVNLTSTDPAVLKTNGVLIA